MFDNNPLGSTLGIQKAFRSSELLGRSALLRCLGGGRG